ncbi:helix-turn-helix domain-containing protein [Mucilaginibacter sp. UR6-1]|uniref:helix-turn-helix domain-containing protein n=1 Tax=Mucilaginibacter sp. UR6-1 TaxID=1435643 RepID=UPI001E60F12D|nr:helix-turn-helix domain-containing protein [Mucilaginibacter sp. UR6-1]MCC8410647.1 helix-turn-helix domain-containing protein [Mucilaginibacter sp. UR6-1]
MLPLTMRHQEFKVPNELQGTIKCFWHNSNNFGTSPTTFEVMPDGYAEIIFYFGELYSLTSSGYMQPLPSPFMMGLLNKPAHFYTQNQLQIIGIRCFPWTVFDLLGLPPGKDSLRVFEHPIAGLQPQLNTCMQAGNIAGAINIVTQFFTNAVTEPASGNMLYKAGDAMIMARGTRPVSRIAAEAHATVRTLERNFKRSSGHTVKDVSALMRFEQVRNHLWIYPDASLAGLAHELGYTDQAHLSREFKRYSGTTPAAFARKAKQGKPLNGDDFVAFVQA